MSPTKDEIAKRLSRVVCEQLYIEPSQVTPEARLIEELGLDSLDAVELTMSVEDEFSLILSDDELEPVQTFGQLCELVERKIAEK